MKNCPKCGKLAEKLIKLDDAYSSAQFTEMLGIPFHSSHYYCITCARQHLEILDSDLIREERNLSKNPDFIINLLKGRIGQVIIEGIFRNFGYEVYPYGYESYLTNIIKDLRKSWSNQTVKQIRSTPDALIYDRELNVGFLIEVKSTTQSPENYWIESNQLKKYIQLWSSAVLTIIHIPTLEIYCKAFDQINLKEKKLQNPDFSPKKEGYSFNLLTEFECLRNKFRLVDEVELSILTTRIKQEILKVYGV